MDWQLDPAPGWPGGAVRWLGQAGFWIDTGPARLLIDPYLSDSLSRKYPARAADYARMMPPPARVEALARPDLVLITHGHTDHLDPDTLAPLVARFPGLPVVVPVAILGLARERAGPGAELIGVTAGQVLQPRPGLTLHVLPAAHEARETDAQGRDLYLGYVIAADGAPRIYHSGDCVPFDGLTRMVAALRPDIALLPVNGRDATRRAAGVPGNFTLEEAVALAAAADIPYLIPHHFGMFAFNTCDPDLIAAAARRPGWPAIRVPQADMALRWRRKAGNGPEPHDRD